MMIGSYRVSVIDWLLIFVPIAMLVAWVLHLSDTVVFICACIAIIPLAGLMGKSTEHLAGHFGPGVGGLMNASFGNAAELIIAVMALRSGEYAVVKASITGSLIGNILLVLGLSVFLGGIRHSKQVFNKTAAGVGSTLLVLSAIALLVPTFFHTFAGEMGKLKFEHLNVAVSIVLFATYLLSLVFSLKTHKHLFIGHGEASEGHHDGPLWSIRTAVVVLVVATLFVALMAELLVHSVSHTAEQWGMSKVFIGVVLVAVIGNAAEHSTAVLMALKNQMDLAVNIAIGSSIQIALFVAPLLVFLSYVIGPQHMGLDFTPFEVIGVIVAVAVVAMIAHDGQSHWMEGVMLLAVYVILSIAFWYLPEPAVVEMAP
ncbi:MAG: calcium/proton exchanger [Phycisphaerales bacterium]|nr:calcium/proton exchanger [Phycisphaerales bacterium]